MRTASSIAAPTSATAPIFPIRLMNLARILPTGPVNAAESIDSNLCENEAANPCRLGVFRVGRTAADSPLLAQAHLVTTDFGSAAFSLLALYTAWRYVQKPSYETALFAGISMGLNIATKF